MGDFMGDISGILNSQAAGAIGSHKQKKDDSMGLNMQDFLTLMVTELQNQSMDATADTSQMLNQMVMMQMVSALTNMTDASIMGYAASLVGKTVTVGQMDANNQMQEVVGTVRATGMMNGQQVIFIDDKYYYMNQIMAVGTLPKPETQVPEETPRNPDKTEDAKAPNVTL